MSEKPTLMETALGGMLQDIGKFMQRAFGSVNQMDPAVRARESVILPVYQDRYSHKHVLWTEAFFQWMEDQGLRFPDGIRLPQVRNMAVFHHKPDAFDALGWLAAEADRLSSGMDRKQRDQDFEDQSETRGWDKFIKTPLLSPFCPVDLGAGQGPQRWQQLAELIPDDRLLPVKTPQTGDYQSKYRELWQRFTEEFKALCQLNNADLFCESLLSLSERYTWAIPSSTIDLPDISLHDHNRTVAAIVACLHAWHEHHGTLDDEAAIKDREQPKFRLLAGDLSGIQKTLFILANQQVKGVNRILRARSFLMGMLTEAAALHCRETLGLTVFSLIQSAGGRFVLLAPDLPDIQQRIDALRIEFDQWMRERFLGELALNLALCKPFAGTDFMPPRYRQVQESLNHRLDEAKQQPLRANPTGLLARDYEPLGVCTACDKRPARPSDDDDRRCEVCHAEQRIGRWLPRAVAASLLRGDGNQRARGIDLIAGLQLQLYEDAVPHDTAQVLSGFRLFRGEDTSPGPWPLRFIANYVPRITADEEYTGLSEEAQANLPGDMKTFEHLAKDALEFDRDGNTIGKSFLAVLKADVDNLGLLFGFGLSHPETGKDRATISRTAALSRMLDLFFTAYMQECLRRDYPETYTVYAGGDDLLLIGPWRQTIKLAATLNTQFRRYTGENPNITLSAGLELIRANHPLNRSVHAAEERLERAKNAGRNRVCLIDETPLVWDRLPGDLQLSEILNGWLRDKLVSTALIYKMLYFAEQRRLAEGGKDVPMESVNWRARWAYHLARNVRENRKLSETQQNEIMAVLNRILGLDQHIRKHGEAGSSIPVSIALYRNRS